MPHHTDDWNVRAASNQAPSAPLSNPTLDVILGHRSIRSFTDEPVSEDAITTILEAVRQAATWAFYQHRTIIRVTDPAVRAEIGKSAVQPYVGDTKGELFILVVDLYRNAQIRREAGVDTSWLQTTAAFLTGVEDTLLAGQNLVTAAESLGLGTVWLGSIGREVRRVIQALQLPELTYPLVGVLVGHPAQEPQYKPRLPLAVMTGENAYPRVNNMTEALAEYDEVVHTYYDLRDANNRVDSFTDQMARAMGKGGADLTDVLAVLHEQGLALR